MRKYWTVFKLSWSRLLAYRFNFFLGRLRNIIVLLLLFYVWRSLTYKTGTFAGYSGMELITYVFGINILRSIIFGGQSRDMASEINKGSFSKYLIQPVNFFWFNFFRELAQRALHVLSAILEVVVFAVILKIQLVVQTDWRMLALFTLSLLLAVFLYSIISFLASLLAFWSREAMGPRFMLEWFLEFASGAYFPLDILGQAIVSFLAYLPFFYIIYLPMSIYLARFDYTQIFTGLAWQVVWLVLLAVTTNIIWQRGLKKYSGEGI